VPNAHWATFESRYGADNGGEYLVATAMRSMSEIDQQQADSKQFEAALGASGMKRLEELSALCLEKSQSNLFMFNPKMSYPPAEWVKEDPGFWKPKMEAPVKKEPAKPE